MRKTAVFILCEIMIFLISVYGGINTLFPLLLWLTDPIIGNYSFSVSFFASILIPLILLSLFAIHFIDPLNSKTK